MASDITRRNFKIAFGSAAVAWSLAARAQQSALPVVGFISAGSPDASARFVTAFRKGLNEAGYLEGQNVTVEYHWLEGFYDRLPMLLADLATLTARDRIPSTYSNRDFVAAGGLMSYGADIADTYRQVGSYTGSILKGEKPADLPVMQSTKFDFLINLKTAKSLGIEVPMIIQMTADEVIE